MAMSPAGPGTKNGNTGEVKQQYTKRESVRSCITNGMCENYVQHLSEYLKRSEHLADAVVYRGI
jgi:hypothetical protein